MPNGIRRLIHLRTLDMFVVPSPGDEGNSEAFLRIEDLDRMKDLRRFSIQIYRRENMETTDDQNLLVQLRNLKRLEVRGRRSTTINLGLMDSLRSLKRNVLESCQTWETLPPLGNFPSLEALIKIMDRVEEVGSEFLGLSGVDATSFPALKELHFNSLHGWKTWEWNAIAREERGNRPKILPQLYSLRISDCSCQSSLERCSCKIWL